MEWDEDAFLARRAREDHDIRAAEQHADDCDFERSVEYYENPPEFEPFESEESHAD